MTREVRVDRAADATRHRDLAPVGQLEETITAHYETKLDDLSVAASATAA